MTENVPIVMWVYLGLALLCAVAGADPAFVIGAIILGRLEGRWANERKAEANDAA